MNKMDSSVIRYFVSVVLVALGLWFGYEIIFVSNSSSRAASGGVAVKPMVMANGTVLIKGGHKLNCNAQKTTKIVTIYEGDPRLEMKMYTFLHDDLSAQVLAHAAKKVRWRVHVRMCTAAAGRSPHAPTQAPMHCSPPH